ncbi:VWA domain-containing protein [Rubellicoccus peritrichatus]|uniref:VWA domain-containing protein n=1 Tax=Rubellicoccus peritrichatus TaxID=3080537 RepID=A0AAQ3L6S9_9BACT|nr:VWA domain-containing protein [Puniceicoccus sp. CR14]WOO39717.1 VWA domain-containing protein [Puniceicoccus sp. CR14]
MWISNPEWFLLAPAMLFVGWFLKALRLWLPLRIACLVLVMLILVNPHWERLRPGVDLWVLVDQSDSARDLLAPSLKEWEQLLEESKGGDDTLSVIDFAGDATIRMGEASEILSMQTNQTDLPLAVNMAVANNDTRRVSKVLLLSDGYSTESLHGLNDMLREAEMPLHHRLVHFDEENDARVVSFRAPSQVQAGEPTMLDIEMQGSVNQKIDYRIRRNKEVIGKGELTLGSDGRQRLRLTDRVFEPGSHHFEVELITPNDPRPGNNRSSLWTEMTAGPRIILLTAYENDPVGKALASLGLPVQQLTQFANLNEGSLSGARAVIINNVPANVLPGEFLESLAFYVSEQGGGLAMLGGKYSFGSGGYYRSPIDEVLPVSMELKEDHKKLAVAMAIVLDRSGSMGAGVAGGRTKMDLANAGASDTVELMGANDAVTVFAVDSEPHVIVPLTAVTGNQGAIQNRIRRIVSMGGGIFVYTGLVAAWEELQKAPAGQKHIILFADAADAEEPGKYKALLDEITNNGGTVSVIGLGTDKNADANFLKDVAKRGNGRIFFNNDPAKLPAIFAQETVAVTRSAFLEETVGLQPTADWMEISAQPMQWPSVVDGYNLSYLRTRAASAVNSKDEYHAPMVAFWRRGSGRSAAVTFPLSGPFSDSIRAWPEYGNFIQTLIRWLVGNQEHPGLGIRTRVDGSTLVTDLFYSDEWDDTIADSTPSIVYTQGGIDEAKEGQWERMAPGHFVTRIPLEDHTPYRGAVQWNDATIPFGPLATQENREWDTAPAQLNALQATANASGGGAVTLLETIWESEDQERFQSLRPILLIALIFLFLVEAAWRRLR